MKKELEFIENCLKKYEYPNIYVADIVEILGGSNNRIFLLSWLYKLILGVESSDEISKDVLINFLNAHGFCLASQTKQFIEMSLDYSVQIRIFYRIFKMLDIVKKECGSPQTSEKLSLAAISDFVQADVNIFKSFGPLKISEDVPEQLNNNHETDSSCVDEEYNKMEKLSVMRENIKSATNIFSDILKHKEKNELNISLDDNNVNILREFNKNISKAKEVIKNIQIMSNLNENAIFDQLVIPEESENEYTGMAKEIIKLIYEI